VENDIRIEELVLLVENMRDEIAALKESVAREEAAAERRGPDMAKIKSFLDDGFAKVSEALRPAVEKAKEKIGKPAGDTVNALEEKIAAHPFASVGVALAAGFVAGKAVGFFISGRCWKG
jgi:ElaB/YqjD/DUF883 family membrane-anchored ribosome-binding protein